MIDDESMETGFDGHHSPWRRETLGIFRAHRSFQQKGLSVLSLFFDKHLQLSQLSGMGLSLRQYKDLVWLSLRDMRVVQSDQPRSLEICGQTP